MSSVYYDQVTEAAARQPTVVITPFHVSESQKNKIPTLQMEKIDTFSLPYSGDPISVAVVCTTVGCPWYFLKVEGLSESRKAFFAGTRHPYDVSKEVLLRDSLFFGAATVRALPVIARHRGISPEQVEWSLIAQDWEAATALLAFRSQDEFRGRLHLPLHNSYDEFATSADFSRAGVDKIGKPTTEKRL